MQLPPSLSEQLRELTAALDDSGTDLEAVLSVLIDDLMAAVPSFLGLTVIIHVQQQPVTLTVFDPETSTSTGASLQMPLDVIAGGRTGNSVVFFAGHPGAFVDFAADIRDAYGLDGQVIVDGHLAGPSDFDGISGLSGLEHDRVRNRAIGALIARGYPPDAASAELRRLAGTLGGDLRAARRILDSSEPRGS